MTVDYSKSLPPYRSLLNPNSKYDYQLHSLIPISQNELNNLKSLFQQKKQFKMKYKSLLYDVKSKISSNSVNQSTSSVGGGSNANITGSAAAAIVAKKTEFEKLPIEIQYHIFSFLSNSDLLDTLTVSKHFYKLSKKFLYKNVSFESTFRFGQFITILRLNNQLGNLIESVDLSSLKTYDDADDEPVLAGWRDWKFAKNPLYVNNQLTKIHSNGSINSNNKKKLNFGFLRSKRNKLDTQNYQVFHQPPPVVRAPPLSASTVPHPKMNKYLLNYSSSKDLPIGYILHLLDLCPNLVSINLANLSLSIDYVINKHFAYKFQNYDTKNNYQNITKNLITIDDSSSIYGGHNNNMGNFSNFDTISTKSTSSRASKTSGRYIWKYSSLLAPSPPVPKSKMFLSDVSLKSVNQTYLTKLNEVDILNKMAKHHKLNVNFRYLNLSSMIWLNKSLVQSFLSEFMFHKLEFEFKQLDLTIDLTNSGMYTDLVWAKEIDLMCREGHTLLWRILKDDLLDDWEIRMRDDRIRRGRIAENYLH